MGEGDEAMRTYLHRLADALKTPEGVGYHEVFYANPRQMDIELATEVRSFARLVAESKMADYGIEPEDIRWNEVHYSEGELAGWAAIVADADFPEFPGVRWIGKGTEAQPSI
jgi:hypothetical protein